MVGSPAFAASFNGVYNHGRLLALADEEGYLTIIDTSQALPRSTADEAGPRPSAQWLAHRNAIFDLAWFREDEAMLAASGDQTISLWDTGMAEQLGTFCGHTGSVKTLDPMPGSRHVFASGARDGQLAVWDTRIHSRTPEGGTPPVLTVQGRPKLSVTSALFLPDARTLATGGVDGMVRLGLKQHGVTCLALHPDGARLLVSLTGGHHLAFDVLRPGAGPRAVYAGHAAASFYVKAGFSPDGRFLASGSSDRRVHVWEGHEGEVTAVAWCPTDPDRLASAADDATVRVWARRPRARDPEPAAERCPRSARQLLSGFLGPAAARGWAGEPAERPAPCDEGRTGPASDPAAPERCATTAISAGALPGLATPATPRGAGTGERGGGSPPPAWRLADYATPGGALAGRSGAAGSGATGRKRARQASIAAFFTSPLRRPVIDLTCQAPG
ncbi:Denticleless protein-like protein [Auxenochlorella protothecoides]|uniref:Denticleless protein-like protein n=1 Tax=Auxenochlorella protothecoides TaxID=3075 RepID=A0A087SIB0_AUXPR|nr:Denticleless protein-like protein [Auxenochlorella protothecoides]KFM25464.1 Denticleless protein-like protein [Auxenochlorella protothecoides]